MAGSCGSSRSPTGMTISRGWGWRGIGCRDALDQIIDRTCRGSRARQARADMDGNLGDPSGFPVTPMSNVLSTEPKPPSLRSPRRRRYDRDARIEHSEGRRRIGVGGYYSMWSALRPRRSLCRSPSRSSSPLRSTRRSLGSSGSGLPRVVATSLVMITLLCALAGMAVVLGAQGPFPRRRSAAAAAERRLRRVGGRRRDPCWHAPDTPGRGGVDVAAHAAPGDAKALGEFFARPPAVTAAGRATAGHGRWSRPRITLVRHSGPFRSSNLDNLQLLRASPVQQPTDADLDHAERQEAEVPRQWPPRSSRTVHLEQDVVDQSLDDVEHAPTCEQQPEVERPSVGCQSTLPPGHDGHGAGHDEQPRADVEEAVCHDVDLEGRQGVR